MILLNKFISRIPYIWYDRIVSHYKFSVKTLRVDFTLYFKISGKYNLRNCIYTRIYQNKSKTACILFNPNPKAAAFLGFGANIFDINSYSRKMHNKIKRRYAAYYSGMLKKLSYRKSKSRRYKNLEKVPAYDGYSLMPYKI